MSKEPRNGTCSDPPRSGEWGLRANELAKLTPQYGPQTVEMPQSERLHQWFSHARRCWDLTARGQYGRTAVWISRSLGALKMVIWASSETSPPALKGPCAAGCTLVPAPWGACETKACRLHGIIDIVGLDAICALSNAIFGAGLASRTLRLTPSAPASVCPVTSSTDSAVDVRVFHCQSVLW